MSRGQFGLSTLRTKLDFLVPVDSSPLRKKQRISSPDYPGFIEDLSPEDLRNLSEIDAAVSQNSYSVTPLRPSQPAQIHAGGLQASPPTRDKRRTSELDSGARNDPVTTQAVPTSTRLTLNGGAQSSLSVPATVGFTSVRAMAGRIPTDGHRSPSPEGPPSEQDYDSWFDTPPTDVPASVGFQSASTTKDTGIIGFTSAGKGTSFQPSKDALESVKKRMRAWEADAEEEFSHTLPPTPQTEVTPPPRPVTPTKPSSGTNKISASPIPASPRQIPPQHTPFTKQKAFKPPLLASKTNLTNSMLSSPSNSTRSKGSVPQFKPPLLSSTSAPTLPKPSTPSRATLDSAFRTPSKLGVAHRPGSTKKFTTPFKPGMRPGDPGRANLQEDSEKKRLQGLQKDQVFQIQMNSPSRKPVYNVPPPLNLPSGSRKGKEKAKEHQFFDLSQSGPNLLTAGPDDQT